MHLAARARSVVASAGASVQSAFLESSISFAAFAPICLAHLLLCTGLVRLAYTIRVGISWLAEFCSYCIVTSSLAINECLPHVLNDLKSLVCHVQKSFSRLSRTLCAKTFSSLDSSSLHHYRGFPGGCVSTRGDLFQPLRFLRSGVDDIRKFQIKE